MVRTSTTADAPSSPAQRARLHYFESNIKYIIYSELSKQPFLSRLIANSFTSRQVLYTINKRSNDLQTLIHVHHL